MKTLMLSIQPQYTMNILNRDKILEIRTTCPKEWKDYLSGKTKVKPEPMKCLIYETKGRYENYFTVTNPAITVPNGAKIVKIRNGEYRVYFNMRGRGKVVAEFVLNEVDAFKVFESGSVQNWNACDLEKSCLTYEQIADYVGRGKTGYALHIDDLKIYDKSKELGEFKYWKKDTDCNGWYCKDKSIETSFTLSPLKRPPQSWMFCEELEEV